jgi:hypothetical protein
MNRENGGRARKAVPILALLLAAASLIVARATTPVAGVVDSIEGKPRVVRADGKNAKLKLNDILNEGDTVKTGPAARVGIAFVGGAELRINENSSFTLEKGGSDKDSPTSVFTKLGNAWTNLIKGSRATINVRTPSAVCAVRGTIADVNIGPDGPMTVKTYEGHVDVMNDKGTTTLHAGELTQVAGGAAPQGARAMTPKDYATWQNSLKAPNLSRSLQLLNSAAVKNRTLDLKMKDKDGKEKTIRLNFEKKEK